jgi:hypothetical protein
LEHRLDPKEEMFEAMQQEMEELIGVQQAMSAFPTEQIHNDEI